MKHVFFIFLFFCLIPYTQTNAVSVSAQKKYPNVLLTNDYNILNENDLGDFSWGFPKNKRSAFNPKKNMGYYWQCFPRESIEITLKDLGSSTSELGFRDNMADLKMEVRVNQNLVHKYEIRKILSISDFEKKFNTWRALMKNEKYVCLAGEYVNFEHHNENGIEKDIYGWIFEKIKTKKGCDSYLYSCHPTRKAYLKRKAEDALLTNIQHLQQT